MQSNDFALTRTGRAQCYKILSACFYPPREETFFDVDLLSGFEQALAASCPGAVPAAQKMQAALTRSSCADLLIEHAKLFVGPFELQAPPYGSVYLETENRLMGDSTIEVQKLYREAGLFLSDDFGELPDHVAAELEFMYYLIFKEQAANEESDQSSAEKYHDRQKLFLNQFLDPWIPPFCERIEKGTQNEFYLVSCHA